VLPPVLRIERGQCRCGVVLVAKYSPMLAVVMA
jgi:hypothetical protein